MTLNRYGRFMVQRELGAGGMGSVLAAHDPQLQRSVALKVIAPQLAHDPGFRTRFRREADLLAQLDSPHIVKIYDHGEDAGQLWIATQLITGGDLATLLSEHGPLPPLVAVEIVAQVAAGLADAHTAGILHRDVKPGNVLLRDAPTSIEDWHAYLCDFGIARPDSDELTRTRGVSGTLAYLAPERATGGPASVATDLYALGCLLWTCLSGHPPYTGTALQTALGHRDGPIPQLPETSPIEGALNGVLRQLLAKRPQDRPATAHQVGTTLRRIARPDSVGDAPPIEPSRKRRGRWLTAALGLLLVASGAGYAVWSRADTEAPAPDPAVLPTATQGVHGDLTGDGRGDLRVLAFQPRGDTVDYWVSVRPATATSFTQLPDHPVSGTAAVGDLDGDGVEEVISFGDSSGSFVSYAPGSGEEREYTASMEAVDTTGLGIAAVDMTGDGWDDLVLRTPRSEGPLEVWLAPRTANGFDAFRQVYSDDRGYYRTFLGDFDGDGDTDVVVEDETDTDFEVLLSDGEKLTSVGLVSNDWHGARIAPGDFDGDGTDELVLAPLGGGLKVLRYTQESWQTEAWEATPPSPSDVYASGVPNFMASDVNGDGRDDVVLIADPTEGSSDDVQQAGGTIYAVLSQGNRFREPSARGEFECACDYEYSLMGSS